MFSEWKHKEPNGNYIIEKQVKNPMNGLNSQLYRAEDKIRYWKQFRRQIYRKTKE